MARTGRPIKNKVPRNKRLSLRLSEKELELLEQCSFKTGLSRTDVIVKSLIEFEKNINKPQ